MDIEPVRARLLQLPQVTETVQWGNDLVFKVGGKMFAVLALEPAGVWLSFKTTPEEYAELVERVGIRPAPYLARAHWVALEEPGALRMGELGERLDEAYRLVVAGLPKKKRAELGL